MCVSLCTNVVHNTAQNSVTNLPSYPPETIIIAHDVYRRGGGPQSAKTKSNISSNVTLMTNVDFFVVDFCRATCCSNKNLSATTPKCSCNKMRDEHGFSDTGTHDDLILISGVLLSVAFVNECKKKTNKRKRSN